MGRRTTQRRRARQARDGRDSAGARQASRGPAAGAQPAVGRRALAAIFATALFVRLVHVWQLGGSPFAELLLGDSAGYDRWARELAAGDWLGSEVFYQAPLYPYLLGVVYTVLGSDVTVVRVCQAVLGAGSAVLLAAAGGRFFSPRVGIAAGVTLALYAPAVFVDATLQKSVVDVFLLTGLLWLLGTTLDGTPPGRRWIGIGALLGALCLTRENALILVAALGVWLWLERRERRDWLRQAALAAAGVALVLAPVALRNGIVGGEWHLTTSQFGPNFYIGNNADADGAYRPLRYGRGDAAFERDDATALAEAAAGHDLTPAGVSRYWVGRTLDDIAAAPGRWLGLLGRKAALTFNAVEVIDTESQYAHAEHSLPLAATGWLTHFGLLVPLAAVGVAVTWPQRRRLLSLYLMLGLYAASVIAFYVFARYRYPLAPFLVLFAAAGGDGLVQVVRRAASLAQAPAVAAVALVCAVGANWPLLSKDHMRAASYNNLATAYRERGDLPRAVQLYRSALTLDANYAQAHSNLGSALAASGDPQRAIEHYRQAVAIDAATGDLRFNYGNALLAANQYAEAAEQFRLAVRAWPDDAEAFNNLGIALASAGGMAEAAEAFREAVRLDPAGVRAHRNLGIALEELGDAAGAERHHAEAERLEASAP
jgi:Tfp pilus assembly protein PilF